MEESEVAGFFVFSHIRNTDGGLFKVRLGKVRVNECPVENSPSRVKDPRRGKK